MVWYLFILFAVLGQDCPVASCEGLELNICVSKQSDNLLINEYGCPDDTTCLIKEVYSWFETLKNNNINQSLYNCTSSDSVEIDLDIMNATDEDAICKDRNPGDMLELGLHPKRCTSNEDCRLLSGALSTCSCGLDGYKYCNPEWGSEVFEAFWYECEDGEVDLKYWKYYNRLYRYYPFYITAPDCSSRIFDDIDFVKPDSGYMIYLSIIGILMLI